MCMRRRATPSRILSSLPPVYTRLASCHGSPPCLLPLECLSAPIPVGIRRRLTLGVILYICIYIYIYFCDSHRPVFFIVYIYHEESDEIEDLTLVSEAKQTGFIDQIRRRLPATFMVRSGVQGSLKTILQPSGAPSDAEVNSHRPLSTTPCFNSLHAPRAPVVFVHQTCPIFFLLPPKPRFRRNRTRGTWPDAARPTRNSLQHRLRLPVSSGVGMTKGGDFEQGYLPLDHARAVHHGSRGRRSLGGVAALPRPLAAGEAQVCGDNIRLTTSSERVCLILRACTSRRRCALGATAMPAACRPFFSSSAG